MQLFTNNAASRLASNISAVSLSLQVKTGEGAKFPSPTGGDFFLITLSKVTAGIETAIEIVKCTARTEDVLTIVRAQEGTTANAYLVDDRVELRMTAGTATTVENHLSNIANPHNVTKAQVGLGNVDNTADANKPVSTAQATADNAARDAAKTYADGLVVGLWDDRGSFDASVNTFPTSGGSGAAGAILKGDVWTISVVATSGVLLGFPVGSMVRATVNTPGQTVGNWSVIQVGLGYVPENTANKDASGGYPSLAGQALKLWNAAKTFYGTLTHSGTANRAYTLQDKNGTLAHTSDTHDATAKSTPVDADEIGVVDSAASFGLKKLTWANLKATLKTYFDTLYYTLGGALGTPSSGTLSGCTVDGTAKLGTENIRQNSQSANYTMVLSDAGKTIFHPSADTTARTWTIPANSSVAFPIGTVITFDNANGAGVITIAITTDTLRLAGAGTTGSRTLAANGIATAIKQTATEWKISGTGLT